MPNPNISRLINIIGRKKIAQQFDIKDTSVTSWHKYGVPPKYCKTLEKLTQGDVTSHQLRPDIFPNPSQS